MIPLCVPHLRGNEWELVKECLDSGWVSYAGSFVDAFEKDLAAATDAGHAAAMISGTSALHVALMLSGVGADDEVLMPALSFVAPANAVRYCGAWPVFIDVSSETWQWDLNQVRDFLENHCVAGGAPGERRNRHTGRRIAALLPVHLLGGMADVDGVADLCREFGLPLVEDAAETLGTTWRGRGIGAPLEAPGDLRRTVCTSFNGNKIITTGGGGALLCNDPETARLARHLSTTAKTDAIEFDHDRVGYNYRMSNMAAALGVAQLAQLGDFVRRKQEIARAYDAELLSLPGIKGSMPGHPDVVSNQWLYTILLEDGSRELLRHLTAKGIQSRPLWKALPDLHFLSSCHVHSDRCARMLVERALSLPCSVGLSDGEQASVVGEIRRFLKSRP